MQFKHDFHSLDADAARPAPSIAPPKPVSPRRARVRSACLTGAMLAGFWQVLHWGDPASWVIGGPAVIGGALTAAALPPRDATRVRFRALPQFLATALWGVIRGATDVSIRSMRPDQLSPGHLRYETVLPEGAPRRLFALVITLMPGTLTVRMEGRALKVHAMDTKADVDGELRRLERRISDLYGLPGAGDTA